MLTEKQYNQAKERQAELLSVLNDLTQSLAGEDNLYSVWYHSFHFQDLGHVLYELKNIRSFWLDGKVYEDE